MSVWDDVGYSTQYMMYMSTSPAAPILSFAQITQLPGIFNKDFYDLNLVHDAGKRTYIV